MKKLNLLPKPYNSYFDEILDSKKGEHKKSIIKIKNDILTRYDEYIDKAENNLLQNLPSTSNPLILNSKASLLVCYNSKTSALDKIKSNIKLAQPKFYQNLCPYCGIGIPSTFDHYIPKEKFPEYSVFVPNLIPCCSSCNQKKGERWKDTNSRIFINFYYDNLFNDEFIDTSVEKDIEKIFKTKMKLYKPNSFTNEQFSIIQAHFKELDLITQYIENGYSFISEIIRSFNILYLGNSKSDVKLLLEKFYNENIVDYGINHFRTQIYKALSKSDDFIDYLIKKNSA